MYYRAIEEDPNLNLGNPSMIESDICTDCPYKEAQEQEFDLTMERQRRPYYHYRPHPYYYRPRPYYYYPNYYPYYYPNYYPNYY